MKVFGSLKIPPGHHLRGRTRLEFFARPWLANVLRLKEPRSFSTVSHPLLLKPLFKLGVPPSFVRAHCLQFRFRMLQAFRASHFPARRRKEQAWKPVPPIKALRSHFHFDIG
ncbi:MAG TPA: hypothetical protein VK327_07155 [Candidatus Paceibacterota bacterium]|nr:hypothetical protein [Candidatus Paceibacterota bacterium]